MGRAIKLWLAVHLALVVIGCSPAPAVRSRTETVEQRRTEIIRTTVKVTVEEE